MNRKPQQSDSPYPPLRFQGQATTRKKHPRVIAFIWPGVWGDKLWVTQLWHGSFMAATGYIIRDRNLPSNEKIDHHIASTAG